MSDSHLPMKITEICYKIIDKKNNITINKILETLDKVENYDKSVYKNKYQQIYSILKRQQKNVWKAWEDYQDTSEYEKQYKLRSRMPNEKLWDDDTFKKIYDSKIFTEKQLNNHFVEASVFGDYLLKLRQDNQIFLIAGRGINTYRIPNLFDFFVYKFINLISEKIRFKNQLQKFTENGLLLPEAITINELKQLEDNVLKTLEFRPEEGVS